MNSKFTILLVEDERRTLDLLTEFLKGQGYNVLAAENGKEALSLFSSIPVDGILLDIRLPDASGLELLRSFRKENPLVKVIMVTAVSDVETVVSAMREGAVDYIVKPVDLSALFSKIEKIRKSYELDIEVKVIENLKETQIRDFVFASEKMREVLYLVVKASRTSAPCLLTGETGTGKTLIARIIHSLSKRKDGPFVDVHLQAIPETLLEAELFGYEKGAFTGAERSYDGLVVRSCGGTLFLDEIGELKRDLQVKLLKVIEEKELRPVGGTKTRAVDFRLITATNRDLKKEVQDGIFREDLYYRINVIEIEIPPLRERREDIPLLLDYFREKYSKSEGKEIKGFSKEAKELLVRYSYPGNVRELSNIVERACVMSSKNLIEVQDLPGYLWKANAEHFEAVVSGPDNSLPSIMRNFERKLIEEALKAEGFIKSRAARRLGVSERVLRYKIKVLGIEDGKGNS